MCPLVLILFEITLVTCRIQNDNPLNLYNQYPNRPVVKSTPKSNAPHSWIVYKPPNTKKEYHDHQIRSTTEAPVPANMTKADFIQDVMEFINGMNFTDAEHLNETSDVTTTTPVTPTSEPDPASYRPLPETPSPPALPIGSSASNKNIRITHPTSRLETYGDPRRRGVMVTKVVRRQKPVDRIPKFQNSTRAPVIREDETRLWQVFDVKEADPSLTPNPPAPPRPPPTTTTTEYPPPPDPRDLIEWYKHSDRKALLPMDQAASGQYSERRNDDDDRGWGGPQGFGPPPSSRFGGGGYDDGSYRPNSYMSGNNPGGSGGSNRNRGMNYDRYDYQRRPETEIHQQRRGDVWALDVHERVGGGGPRNDARGRRRPSPSDESMYRDPYSPQNYGDPYGGPYDNDNDNPQQSNNRNPNHDSWFGPSESMTQNIPYDTRNRQVVVKKDDPNFDEDDTEGDSGYSGAPQPNSEGGQSYDQVRRGKPDDPVVRRQVEGGYYRETSVDEGIRGNVNIKKDNDLKSDDWARKFDRTFDDYWNDELPASQPQQDPPQSSQQPDASKQRPVIRALRPQVRRRGVRVSPKSSY